MANYKNHIKPRRAGSDRYTALCGKTYYDAVHLVSYHWVDDEMIDRRGLCKACVRRFKAGAEKAGR